MFRVGQKVVCVGTWPADTWLDLFCRFISPYRAPVRGRVYTVAAIPSFDRVELVELPSPETRVWTAGFLACGFRPLIERKTDISVFTEILRKHSKKKPAPAFSIQQAWHG